MTNYVNYSIRTLTETHKTLSFLSSSTSTLNSKVSLYFKIIPNLRQLAKQSEVFAINAMSLGYLDFYRVLNCRPDEVKSVLEEVFVYSFTKAYHNSVFFNNISYSSNLGFVFEGHLGLFKLLRNPNNAHFKGDLGFFNEIMLGSEIEKEAVMLALQKKFNFLEEYSDFGGDALGTSPFIIPRYESYLARLRQNHYSKEHVVSSITDTKFNDSDSDYTLGRLCILEFNQVDMVNITEYLTCPLPNSFVRRKDNSLCFIPVGNGKPVEFNPSFFFSMANFLYLVNDDSTFSLESLYHIKKLDDTMSHLICSEVHAITGLKCRTFKSKTEDAIDLPFDPEKLTEYMEKLGKTARQVLVYIASKSAKQLIEDFELEFGGDKIKGK